MSNTHGLSPFLLRAERRSVLWFASAVAVNMTDPNEVLRHASNLTTWLEEADSDDDRKDRLAALERAFANWSSQQPAPEPPGTADGLLHTARHYYEYLAA